jgi:membrane-associated phospholipid phosphatase
LSRRQWVRLAVGCVLAFVVLTIPVGLGRNWPGEWALVEWVLAARSPAWTVVMQTVTFFGSSSVGVGLSAGCSVALFVRQWRAGFWRLDQLVWLPLVCMFGSAPINFGLRYACGRVRPGVTYIPHHLPELSHPFQRWSYPSGHAMTATICYGLLVYFLLQARPRWQGWTLWVLGLGLAAIGFSRVYLGVHWPTDVLAGYLAGGAWLALCIAFWGTDRQALIKSLGSRPGVVS